MSLLIKKWFNFIGNTDGSSALKAFFRPYEIKLDPWFYNRLDELLIRFVEVTNCDPHSITINGEEDPEKKTPYTTENSPFSLDKNECLSRASMMMNMYLIADIEEVWRVFGVNTVTSKSGPAVRKIKTCRAVVKERLEKRFKNTFIEFEKVINNFEAMRNGHPEGTNTSNENIMDLKKRDSTIRPEDSTAEEDTSNKETSSQEIKNSESSQQEGNND